MVRECVPGGVCAPCPAILKAGDRCRVKTDPEPGREWVVMEATRVHRVGGGTLVYTLAPAGFLGLCAEFDAALVDPLPPTEPARVSLHWREPTLSGSIFADSAPGKYDSAFFIYQRPGRGDWVGHDSRDDTCGPSGTQAEAIEWCERKAARPPTPFDKGEPLLKAEAEPIAPAAVTVTVPTPSNADARDLIDSII